MTIAEWVEKHGPIVLLLATNTSGKCKACGNFHPLGSQHLVAIAKDGTRRALDKDDEVGLGVKGIQFF